MQEIAKEIIEKYGFEVKNINSFRGVNILDTSEGKKILKRCNLSTGRILFIHGAKEHLVRNGFIDIDRYTKSVEGEPFITINSINYTVSDGFEGRECNFDIRDDVIKATRTLAIIHQKSKGYIYDQGTFPKDELGILPNVLKKRLYEIKRLKKLAQKGKKKFDYMVNDYIDYFYDLGLNTFRLLNNSKYNELVNITKFEGSFCHCDYTHNNIIFNNDRTVITNFENCSLELKIYDVVNLIRRKLRKCNWNPLEAQIILNEYNNIEKITRDELFVMKIMLKFPQKFWRVINKYYNTKRSCSEKYFLGKLQEVIDEIEPNKEFISCFDDII